MSAQLNPSVPDSQGAILPALIVAAASPVAIFYGAGYLLSFGYFFAMGPALMTAFSPSEIALVGFTRMAGTVAVGAFFAFFLVTATHLIASRTAGPAMKRGADLFGGTVCFLAAAAVGALSWRAGFLAVLLGIVAVFVMGGIGTAFLLGREDWVRRRSNPWRWMLPLLLLVIGLPALGEAGFREAIDPARASWITVVLNGKPVSAKLLMLGSNSMIYEAAGQLYVAGPRGESSMRLGLPVSTGG